jgi:hypothetical protein
MISLRWRFSRYPTYGYVRLQIEPSALNELYHCLEGNARKSLPHPRKSKKKENFTFWGRYAILNTEKGKARETAHP